MTFRRSDGPADRAESERLLDAARTGGSPAPGAADPLAHLLAAAAAPAKPGELSAEEQAVAAFRAARANPAPAPTPPRRRRIRVGVAAWAAGLAATATAGVAFAAVSLDRPDQPTSPPAPTTAGSSGAPSRSAGGSPGAGTSGPAVPPTPDRSGGPGRPATVEQLTGLCRAYLAKPAGLRAKSLETPAFADLVAAAGGAEQVDAYCVQLVADPGLKDSPGPRASQSPADEAAPTSAHPTGKPGSAG
ncbi:hypothetical protein ACL02O_09770 [Micromonospora sp. MS34]|uniref:hypothetical protein n=1 Tax=Micromonospora sp. MS34 TaxID=3385971 RepID=UPI0039A18F0B